MGKKKAHAANKGKQTSGQKRISPAKRNEINVQCERVFHLSSNPAFATQLWTNYLEISAALEKVKRLEDMKSEPQKRIQAESKFMKWLQENNVNTKDVSIAEYPSYELGLKAQRDIDENELLLEIPRKLIFSVESVAPELQAIKNDPLIHHLPQVELSIALLIEKHKQDSKWKPYLDILPSSYNTVLYVSTNDMMELKGSPTLDMALKQCRNIARQYSYFNKLFQNSHNAVSDLLREVFTYEEFCWAVSTVMTRQNMIPSEDGSHMIHALIPLWDICNHEEGRITTDFNKLSDCCECYALRNFKAGEQIFINYGSRTNAEFFVHSGFVSLDNKNDSFKLRLGISKADPLQKPRQELLEKLGLPSNGEFLLKSGPEPVTESLLAFLRVFCLRKEELDHWHQSSNVSELKSSECALDPVVEKNVWNFLLTRIKLLVSNYPTTSKEDEELLKTNLPSAKKLIVELRLSEKKLLQNAYDYAEKRVEL